MTGQQRSTKMYFQHSTHNCFLYVLRPCVCLGFYHLPLVTFRLSVRLKRWRQRKRHLLVMTPPALAKKMYGGQKLPASFPRPHRNRAVFFSEHPPPSISPPSAVVGTHIAECGGGWECDDCKRPQNPNISAACPGSVGCFLKRWQLAMKLETASSRQYDRSGGSGGSSSAKAPPPRLLEDFASPT